MHELNVEIRGRGPKLVLLHGWGLNLRVWDGLSARLADHFQLIAVDLPGHGRSPWHDDARALQAQARAVHETLRRRLQAHPGHTARLSEAEERRDDSRQTSETYSVLGWSLGGQVALQLALLEPACVGRLVLVATTPRFVAAPDWPHGMAPEVLNRFADHLAGDYRRTVSEFLELQVRGSSDSQAVLESLRAALLEHGEARPQALEAGLEILAAGDLRRALPEIVQPALVVAGQYDRVTPPGAARALAAALPHAQHVEFRRAGHAPLLSHAEAFARAVSEFLGAGSRSTR